MAEVEVEVCWAVGLGAGNADAGGDAGVAGANDAGAEYYGWVVQWVWGERGWETHIV